MPRQSTILDVDFSARTLRARHGDVNNARRTLFFFCNCAGEEKLPRANPIQDVVGSRVPVPVMFSAIFVLLTKRYGARCVLVRRVRLGLSPHAKLHGLCFEGEGYAVFVLNTKRSLRTSRICLC